MTSFAEALEEVAPVGVATDLEAKTFLSSKAVLVFQVLTDQDVEPGVLAPLDRVRGVQRLVNVLYDGTLSLSR